MGDLSVGNTPVKMATETDSGDGNMTDTVSDVHMTTEPSSDHGLYRIDSMECRLRAAMIESGFGNGSDKSLNFLPLDKIQEIVSPSSVTRELEAFSRLTDSDREPLIKWIFADPGCRKIFAILALIERVKDITIFVEDGLSDSDMPFDTSQTPRAGVKTGCLPKKVLQVWPKYLLEVFEDYQWMVLAPFFSLRFREINHYAFENTIRLPFLKDTDDHMDSGGFSDVWRVRIHRAHHLTDPTALQEDSPPYAIKRLKHHCQESFDKEVLALKRLSGSSTPHLICLLATYEHKGAYHLIFPWADGNLLNLWKSNPQPDILSVPTAGWFKNQLLGLAEGLYAVHRLDPTATNSAMTSLSTSRNSGFGDQNVLHGRHGDLKPENILWFRTSSEALGTSDMERRVLKIADFGLSSFHTSETRSGTMARTVPISPTYRPPESDIGNQFVSQATDIWSLGCIFVEFLTWALGGWRAVEEFTDRRARDDWNLVKETRFFHVLMADLTAINEPRDSAVGVLKPAVVQWSNQLRARTNCTGYMHDLISLVMDGMLQIDPENRISAQDLYEVLRKMSDKGSHDEYYLSQPGTGRGISNTYSRIWIPKAASSVDILDSGTSAERSTSPELSNHSNLANGASLSSGRKSSVKQIRLACPEDEYTTFSCPFRKRNPVRFNVREYQTCALRSFSGISQVERHIQSVHGTAGCGSTGSPDDRVAFDDPEAGLSAAAGAKLRDRRTNFQVLDWSSLWGVLFPDDMVIPSGEYEPVIENHEAHRRLIEGSESFQSLLSSMKPAGWPGGSGEGSRSLDSNMMPTTHVWSAVEVFLSLHFSQKRTGFTSSKSTGSFGGSIEPSNLPKANRHTTKTTSRTTKATADPGAKRVTQTQGRYTRRSSELFRQLAPIPPVSPTQSLPLSNLGPVDQPTTHSRGPSVTNSSSVGSNLTEWSCNNINSQSSTRTAITEPENDITSSKRAFEEAFPEYSTPGNICAHTSQPNDLGSVLMDFDIQIPELAMWDEMVNDQDIGLNVDADFDWITFLDTFLPDSNIGDLDAILDPHTF